ncbi:MAG TPA: hypothetical protein VM536_09195 [Chloroflexia bacterium]|nr:hypothetical protein [Chloroflexia bacterium]
MSSQSPGAGPRADARLIAAAEKEALAAIDPVVRRVLGELAEAQWGRNGAIRRHWTLTHNGGTWRARHAARAEQFTVTVDLSHHSYRVDCTGGPLFTDAINEEQLRRALAVAHHRGPVAE